MGSLNVNAAGTWRPAKAVHVNVGGTWRAAKEVWVKAGGVWQKAWVSLSATISPSSVSASKVALSGSTTVYASVSCVVEGDATGATFLWQAQQSGPNYAGFVNANAQSTQMVLSGPGGTEASGTITCTVTVGGTSVVTPPVPFTLRISSGTRG